MKKIAATLAVTLLVGLMAATAFAGYSYSSTNEWNRTGENPLHPGVVGPHAYQVSAEDGAVILALVNPFTDFACFEYRIDGDTSSVSNAHHPNPDIDGPYYHHRCVSNGSFEQSFVVDHKVEVRLAHMSHADWYFDWATFPEDSEQPREDDPALPEERESDPPGAQAHDECKQGGWQEHGFRNQGLCVQYLNTGKDSR